MARAYSLDLRGRTPREFRTHPEAKSANADGKPCGRGTVGLLRRRVVRESSVVYVGKETNRLEEVEAGAIHDWQEVQLVFRQPGMASPPPDAATLASKTGDRHCRQCGAMLTDTRRLYCSAACRQRAYRRRQPQAP